MPRTYWSVCILIERLHPHPAVKIMIRTGQKMHFSSVCITECGCEYKCDVDGNDFTCLCMEGYELADNGRTCQGIIF